MRSTKLSKRVEWIKGNMDKIIEARKTTDNHSDCRGDCHNGATCKAQSGGGFGFWAQALREAGVDCRKRPYWSGSNPTPSTSINRGIADLILTTAPADIR